MIIMSKLTCHVNAILKVGADGAKLQDMLVSGDVSLCYAMGMRGLVGKEAINPWKCVGVEIPVHVLSSRLPAIRIDITYNTLQSQNFIKNVSKPPLGTVAGDWTCSCGREVSLDEFESHVRNELTLSLQNWAKRSVCSRCFPGIEPEYKSLVFNKVKPIFDFIAVQEQNGDAQKDAEWLAAEERRMRHEHLKYNQNGTHSGPVIGKQFVADSGRPPRQSSHSPSLQDSYPTVQRSLPTLPVQYLPYPHSYAGQQAGPFRTVGSVGSVYHYPMVDPNPLFGYGHRAKGSAHRPVAQHDSYLQSVSQQDTYHQYSFPRTDIQLPTSLHPASSSRFSAVASSESASDSRFSPFSRSGSQQTLPKVGFTVTEASSMGSIQTIGTSSSGKSLREAEKREAQSSSHALGLSKTSEQVQLGIDHRLETQDVENPFSPFSQPQVFAEQVLQAKHRSAKKAVLRPTRSVSPIGHGRPEAPVDDVSMEHSHREAPSSPDVLESEESASYATEESYVYALGSLLQDVQL